MCGLCGVYRRTPHWSDPIGGSETRRERLRRLSQVNVFTRPTGISIKDFCGSSFVVANRKGKSKVVYTADDMWAATDELGEQLLDPLDEATILRVSRHER